MGYELYITRKKMPWDEEGPEIPLDEWLAYVASDPELRPAPEILKHAVRLKVPSEYPDPWMDWFGGNVYAKNPDRPIVEKMLKIASALHAKVTGDNGETLRSAEPGDHYFED
jgi:hypothetical protein